MAYYLSRRNEIFLQPVIQKLKDAKSDIILDTENPPRLVYLLRNAAGTENYSWLRDKYIFKTKERSVLCKIRSPVVQLSQEGGSEDIKELSFFDVINDIFNASPEERTYSRVPLQELEVVKLEQFATKQGYSVSISPNTIKITKNEQ